MKKIIFLLLISFISKAQNLNLMTYNIRYSTKSDGVNQWDNRKDHVAEILKYYEVDICGMQEALFSQITDLKERLPNHDYIGKGRDDGKEKGEFSPIFFDKTKFELLKSETIWLSETPEVPGKSWDAAFPRVVTWAYFKDKKSRKKFYVFNTHFDHMGQVARRESAKLILKKIKEIAADKPVFLIGDFNGTPDSEPIQIIKNELIDSEIISTLPHFGPVDTFTGFEAKERENSRIDFIFLNNKNIIVKKHATLSNTWGGLFGSDHHAVLVNLKL